jgi:outer membrane assembly lipoprotein YfiO
MAWTLVASMGFVATLPGLSSGQDRRYENGRWVEVAEPREGTPEGELSLIRKHLADGSARKAQKLTEKWIERYPDHEGLEEAMFLRGQAMMDRGRYANAYEAFEEQLASFPGGMFVLRALHREYDIANAFVEGRKRRVWGIFWVGAEDYGTKIFTSIAATAPGTSIARKALLRMGDYYYEDGQYAAAVRVYDEFLKIYPKSKDAAYAMLQAARASHAQYRGVKYQDTPLLSARQRYRNFAEAFPEQASQIDVERILEDINESLAHKKHHIGRFYERVGRDGAATFYYRIVVDQFPGTRWADLAEEDLRRLDVQAASDDDASDELSRASASGKEES